MDPDYILPPPAYSEQELDQKISQATALSLNSSQVSLTNIDADGWPQYDPAAFEATSIPEGSSTSPIAVERSSSIPMETSVGSDFMQHGDLPSIVPLRIEKKSQKKSLAKPPAIYQPNESSSLTVGENPPPTLFHSGISNSDDFRSQPHAVPSTCAGDDVSLTTVPVHSTQIKNKRDASLFSIPPPPPFEALACPPESSLFAQPHVDPHNITPNQSPRRSLPIQSHPRLVPPERPMSSCLSPDNDNFQSSYVPRLDFNPSIAYGRNQSTFPLVQSVKSVQYDPHAFYNSAVSAQITPITSVQHGHSLYSPYNSRNSFSPQKPYQQGPPASYSRPGHYHNSQNFVSQDPLLLERSSSSPFEMNSSRQSVLQSPARPSSSYSMSSNYQTFNASPSPVYQYANHTANVPGNIYYDQSAENRWSTQ